MSYAPVSVSSRPHSPMLLSLAAGLFVKAGYESVGDSAGPYMSRTSTGAIVVLIVSELGLGTAQRNLSAALVVAAQDFGDDADVLALPEPVAWLSLS